jgi:hypothetical protein
MSFAFHYKPSSSIIKEGMNYSAKTQQTKHFKSVENARRNENQKVRSITKKEEENALRIHQL